MTVAEPRRYEAVRDLQAIRSRTRQLPVEVWQRRYQWSVFALDLVLVVLSMFIALYVRFGGGGHSVSGVSYVALSLECVPVWLAVLFGARAYETRFLGTGADEFKLVTSASLRLMAAIAIFSFLFKIHLDRAFFLIALPLGTGLLLLGRYAQRRLLHARRRRGGYQRQVLAVGAVDGIDELAQELAAYPYVGLRLVGACLPERYDGPALADVPIVGSVTDVLAAAVEVGADTVVVTAGPGMSPDALRRLSWELEGTGINLIVAPELLDVAGPRVSVRPVPGVPLLSVEEPELSGPRQILKSVAEWLFATIAFTLMLPFLALLCIAIRIDSLGAPLFRQTRVGRHGHDFTVYKLRTMHADAETLLESLREQNEVGDGLLFKMRADPRITRLGRYLRKWSLDELPQFWNVVKGDMALVGPRPPLPGEVSQYGPEVARRLLVRPGITGLWQVSGRSNLSWEESVRLDLYYVENWSLALDAMIVWKTFFAIFRKEGAF